MCVFGSVCVCVNVDVCFGGMCVCSGSDSCVCVID